MWLRFLLVVIVFQLSSLANPVDKNRVSFLAFGDSGYHYDFLKPKVINNPLTPKEYIEKHLKKWREKYLPEEEFVAPPMHQLATTQQAVEASGLYPVAKAMKSYCQNRVCEFAIMLGDNIYPNGATGHNDTKRFRTLFEEPYDSLTKTHPKFKIYAALGNHDWKTSREGREIQVNYGQRPDTVFTMKNPGYYSYTRGPVEFFVIDTNLLLAGTEVKEHALNPDGSERPIKEIDEPESWELPNNEDLKQLSWLEKGLKNSKAQWKIVYGHHTFWSAGGSKFEEAKAMRRLIGKMLCQHADAYFSGHEHALEINMDSCSKYLGHNKAPLPIVISGAGAKQRAIHHPFQSYQEVKYPEFKAIWSKGMTWGFAHVEITGNNMIVQMITTPNSGSGQPQLVKTVRFRNRTQSLSPFDTL